MNDYFWLMATALFTIAVGSGGASGLFSLSFGSHKEQDHPVEAWRSANVRAGISVAFYGVIMGVASFVARSQTPDLDTAMGVALTVGLVIPLAGVVSSMRILGRSRSEQRNGQLLP